MSPSGRVVRLARCENVPGFPALLNAMLAETGGLYYPEYVVHEEYRPFGMGQFMCQVNFIDQDNLGGSRRYIHQAYGLGLTVEQAVQEAAHTAVGWYRYYNSYLAAEESSFTHYPGEQDTPEGVHRGEYTEPSSDESLRYRALVALVQAFDARSRQWFRCAINARANHLFR